MNVSEKKSRRIYFFTRIGGKHRVAPKLLEYMPPLEEMDTYVEPFAGAAQLFLFMPLLPPKTKIVLNDIDRDIYHMWKDVRVVDEKEMRSMPWEGDRQLFHSLKHHVVKKTDPPHLRLFRNLYLSYYSFSGDKSGGFASKPSIRGKHFLDTLPLLKKKLEKAVILNQDYIKVLQRYDSPHTFFYLDPPYLGKDHLYGGRGIDPVELYHACLQLKGNFLLSYNRDKAVEKLFGKHFYLYTLPVPYISTKSKNKVEELLISNVRCAAHRA